MSFAWSNIAACSYISFIVFNELTEFSLLQDENKEAKGLPVVLTGDLCDFLPALLHSPAQYFSAAGALLSVHTSEDSEDVERFLLELSN